MLRLKLWIWREARAVGPIVHKVEVVSGRLALAEAEDVEDRQRERDDGNAEGLTEAAPSRAEHEQQRHDEKEDARNDEPKQVAIEAPCLAFGIVGTVRVGKAQLVVFHWKEPTSTEAEEGNSGGWWAGE